MELKTYKDFKNELIKNNIPVEDQEKIQALSEIIFESLRNGEIDKIDKLLHDSKKETQINEGLLGAAVGAASAAAIGPAIMKAVCKALGISEGSALYNLLTSKLVLASISWTLFK